MSVPKISACSLSRDDGPDVCVWIRNHDDDRESIHVDLTAASARALALQLNAAANDAELWSAKRNAQCAEVVMP